MKGAIAGIVGIIGFMIVKDFVISATTDSWSTMEITLVYTMIPVIMAVGVLLQILKSMGVLSFGK